MRLRIEDVGTDVIAERVRSGRCDIGVGTFKRDEEGVDRQRALTDRLMVFVPPSSLRCRRANPLGASSRTAHRDATRESEIRLLTEIGFQSADIALRPALEVHQIYTALALVEAGAGAAVLPSYANAAPRRRELVARLLCEPHVTREVSLITARDRGLAPARLNVHGVLRKVLREMVLDGPQNEAKS